MTRWNLCSFSELTTTELYALLKLRQDVFVLEQSCLYPDLDNIDQSCHHLCGFAGDEIIACARIMPPGLIWEQVSFGRVAVAEHHRASGLGRELTRRILSYCEELYPGQDIKISAQVYLDRFYRGFGFVKAGEPFDEDGIDHMHMLFGPTSV